MLLDFGSRLTHGRPLPVRPDLSAWRCVYALRARSIAELVFVIAAAGSGARQEELQGSFE